MKMRNNALVVITTICAAALLMSGGYGTWEKSLVFTGKVIVNPVPVPVVMPIAIPVVEPVAVPVAEPVAAPAPIAAPETEPIVAPNPDPITAAPSAIPDLSPLSGATVGDSGTPAKSVGAPGSAAAVTTDGI
jgi:hypothetical protein